MTRTEKYKELRENLKSCSILIINTPNTCIDCPCWSVINDTEIKNGEYCEAQLRPLSTYERKHKPSWCPLITL